MAFMDVALSDLLTCPRCGPTHGLILLPDEVRDRRVITGVLGCANCRDRYPVTDGVAKLGAGGAPVPGRTKGTGVVGSAPDPEEAVRMAALLDLGEGVGVVLLAGPAAAYAGALAAMLPELSVVAVGAEAAGAAGVSALRVDATVPLRSGALRGVALTGEWAGRVEEGARLLGPAGRLVLERAPDGAAGRVQGLGLRVLLEQDEVLVAGRGR